LQACISLSAAGDSLHDCDKLIELVGSSESGMLHLFSQQQLQVYFCDLRFICPACALVSFLWYIDKIVFQYLLGIPDFGEGMLDI